jgi:hypothetical protein
VSAPQFTPGPWRIDGLSPRDGWGAQEGEDSIELAVLPHDAFDALEIYAKRRKHDDYDEFAANARLIAAAPELYEGALDTVLALKLLRIGLAHEPKALEVIDAHVDELEFALAKARGDQ